MLNILFKLTAPEISAMELQVPRYHFRKCVNEGYVWERAFW